MARDLKSQTIEHEEVLRVLDLFLDGLHNRDVRIWEKLIFKKAASFTFRREEGGSWIPNYRPNEDWLSILSVEERELHQNFDLPIVHIRGPIAMIWAPYRLARNGEPAHQGIDCFLLIKFNNEWKIFSVLATQEPFYKKVKTFNKKL